MRHRVKTLIASVALLMPAIVTVVSPQAEASTPADTGSKGPVGWDVFRHLDALPTVPVGVQTKQFSSFDRTGGNDDGFLGTYSCLRTTSSGCVIAERSGAGEIDSIWFTRDEGNVSATGTIRIELDGKVVLDAPIQDVVDGKLGAPFVHPLVANAAQSSGGVYIKVPMPYRDSMRVTMQGNPLFYHVTYRTFPDAEGVTTFDPSDKAQDVIDTLKASGTADPKPPMPGATTEKHALTLAPGKSVTLTDTRGPGELTALRLHLPQLVAPLAGDPAAVRASDDILSHVRVRASFDGVQTVDAPLGEFFGTGLGFNPVRSLMYGVDTDSKWMSAWWPMPYRDRATVTLYNGSQQPLTDGESDVTAAASAAVVDQLGPTGQAGYFRATSRLGHTTPGQDHVFLHTGGWGKFVGVSTTMRGDAGSGRGYLEGDERVYVDGAQSPQLHGTGSEDYYEGGWYFNFGPFSDPVNGNTAQMRAGEIGCDTDCVSAYRLQLTDAVPFASGITFGIEHGPTDDVPATYGSTAYWYGRTQVTALQTDVVQVGDPASEQAHGYTSSGAAGTLTSTFEGNNGAAQPVTSTLRSTTAPVTFRSSISPGNRGVQLRRMSDQQNGFQSAEVFVDGTHAGTWLQPLANGSHRWLDDVFTLPAALTTGKVSVTIRLVPTSGSPAWSAARYTVQSLVGPLLDRVPPSQVTGVTALCAGDTNAIRVSWQPTNDNVGVDHYNVYASTEPNFAIGPNTLVGSTSTTSFAADGLGRATARYVRVQAVDASGNTGIPSSDASPSGRVFVSSVSVPDQPLFTGQTDQADVLVCNDSSKAVDVNAEVDVPEGWTAGTGSGSVPASGLATVHVPFTPSSPPTVATITAHASSPSTPVYGQAQTEVFSAPRADQALFALDAGTPSSPVLTTYTRLSPNDMWDATRGFGWVGTAPQSRDRGGLDDLRRDIVTNKTTPGTLRLHLPAGSHTAYLLIGDRCCAADAMTVSSGGQTMLDLATPLQPGVFRWYSFTLDGGASGRDVDLDFAPHNADQFWRFAAFVVE